MIRLGANQKKALLLLGTAAALMFCHNSRQSYRLIRSVAKDWRAINRQNIARTLRSLEERKLVSFVPRGKYFTPVLTAAGRRLAEFYRMTELRIPRPKTWDRKWRIVMFDVLEDDRRVRNFFRNQLKRLGFYELQKSVFVYPYPCKKQMERLSDLYRNGAAIRYVEATYVDNHKILTEHFNLR